MSAGSLLSHPERLNAVSLATSFRMSGGGGPDIHARGVQALLPPASNATVANGVSAFFARAGDTGGAHLLVGALPFDDHRPAHIFQPVTTDTTAGIDARTGLDRVPPVPRAGADTLDAPVRATITEEPARETYLRSVANALVLLGEDRNATLRKVVLARTLLVRAEAPFEMEVVLDRLRRDRKATTYFLPLPTHPAGDGRALVGATPELLVDRRGERVVSCPFAGSARRHADAATDRASAAALMASSKDLHEHGLVVESVADVLTPYCRSLRVPRTPSLRSTMRMWHLATPIEGTLRSTDTSSVELAAALHPTPAVCGLPREAARDSIRSLEALDRGFFAGAVGWCDGAGDGRWMVAIRCAEIEGSTARLFAGAGIVPGSIPEAETVETRDKFATMLDALGVREQLT